MKKLTVLLLVLGSMLAGCVAYEVPVSSGLGYYDRDRDHDGVPNRFDRRPNDPSRY